MYCMNGEGRFLLVLEEHHWQRISTPIQRSQYTVAPLVCDCMIKGTPCSVVVSGRSSTGRKLSLI
jgi:hypothetical protein